MDHFEENYPYLPLFWIAWKARKNEHNQYNTYREKITFHSSTDKNKIINPGNTSRQYIQVGNNSYPASNRHPKTY